MARAAVARVHDQRPPLRLRLHVRATGSGLAYNFGRFGTAIGVMGAGFLFGALGGDYPGVGAVCALVYALGVFASWLVRDVEPVEGKSSR